MKPTWDRIHTWLRDNAPAVLASLRPGASEEHIRAAEQAMGVTLPADVRACYRLHDGQDMDENGIYSLSFLYGWQWFSLDRISSAWSVWKGLLDDGAFVDISSDPEGSIRDDWWHPAWLPLAGDGAGNYYCVDLAPTPLGQVGQIITMWRADGMRAVLALSFEVWLREFAGLLEDDEFVYVDEEGLMDRDEYEAEQE